MAIEPRRWIGTAILVPLLAASFFWSTDPYVSTPLWGIGAGLLAAAGCVALVSYREARNPTQLYAGIGAGAVAIQVLVLVALQGGLWRGDPARLGAADLYGALLARAIFAICLLMAAPWRERRGQIPPRGVRTFVVLFVVLGVGQLLALLFAPADTTFGSAGVLAGLLTITVADLAAGVRLLANRRGSRTVFGWFAAACFAAAMLSLTAVTFIGREPIFAPYGYSLRSLMALGEGAFMLAGTLDAVQIEGTRMRRATDRATQVMEGRAEIASIVAHDVRGPAGTIRSVAGSLRTSYQRLGDAERLEFVGMIEQESLRLLRVAEQMSLGLKTDAGTMPFTFVARDVEGPVLQGVHDADAGPREVTVEAGPGLRARVDERWLAEAVRQGIENAMKFSAADAPIAIRARAEDGTAVIEIEDRGPGIPADMRETVFEKFSRWRPPGYEDRSGSGLGLFVVRSIAREHGGDAVVAPSAAGGTILQIRVPLEGGS